MTMDGTLLLHLFENTLDWVCIVDKQGWFRHVNPAVVQALGYSLEELCAEPVSARIHPDDRERTGVVRNRLIQNEPLVNFQNRYVAKDGRTIWLQWTSVYMSEKELVFAIAKDISARKESEIEAEKKLQKFQELTAHFKNLAERDRQLFASELHEEIGQLATVLKIDWEWVGTLPLLAGKDVRKRIEHGLTTTQTLIDKIRKLTYAMDPSPVDELGLDATLRALGDEFMLLSGIACTYSSSFKEEMLSREVKLDLLRICQEALASVLQHAQATKVAIRLWQKEDGIELSVQDNGTKFTAGSGRGATLGNINRRAASINAECTARSLRSKGNTLTVRIGT